MAEEPQQPRAREAVKDSLRAGIGILAALKEAIEETIEEMRQRGELSPERAKEAFRQTMKRAQEAMEEARERAQQAVGEARERLDFVPRRDFEGLRDEIGELRRRVTELEQRGGSSGTPQGE
ncbi:MAG: hypothetical protein HY561_08945 [Gemmatimonadetes bacterium]|nr:hypothetical protein [Gemmatimonadota bacterium]